MLLGYILHEVQENCIWCILFPPRSEFDWVHLAMLALQLSSELHIKITLQTRSYKAVEAWLWGDTSTDYTKPQQTVQSPDRLHEDPKILDKDLKY